MKSMYVLVNQTGKFDISNFSVKTWTDLLRLLSAVQIPCENSESDENCGHGLEGLPELFHLQKLTLKIKRSD